jgi:tRNA (guanine-N7-)-methyltransferase
MAQLLPRLRVPIPETGFLDPFDLFQPRPRDVWLEVGFGGGEHLAAQAESHPDVGLLGCEPFVDGVARLLGHVDERGLENVRILDDDARLLLTALPDACLSRVFVLFADPWPKKRHHKRRFIGPGNLDALARVLADGGELRFASDHDGYVRWALRHLTGDRRFRWIVGGPADWRRRPDGWVETRYEAKALARGETCTYLVFRRLPRAAAGAKSLASEGENAI